MAHMQKTEVAHHSREQVRDYLAEALMIVEELEIEDELRIPAFVKAVDLISSKQLFFEQFAATPHMAIPRGH